MRKLPKILKQIIKKKRFSLNTVQNQRDWKGGMKIDYRITMVKSCEENYYEHLTPLNTDYGRIEINLKVKGYVETQGRNYSDTKLLTEISKATKTRKNGWGGYETVYDRLWGSQVNKRVRSEIRSKVRDEIKDFLKLMGITTRSWDGGIQIKTINWEK
jgi:hypothetical protein